MAGRGEDKRASAFTRGSSHMSRCCLLLRHATPIDEDPKPLSEQGKLEAAFAADGLCAYLELPSNFVGAFASGEPCAVKIYHSGKDRAAQTAACVSDALTKAGCAVTMADSAEALSPNADPAAAVDLVKSSDAPLTVLVGHLPHLHKCAGALGISISADAFAPAAGALLECRDAKAPWELVHTVTPMSAKKDWWIHGVSKYVPAEEAEAPSPERLA